MATGVKPYIITTVLAFIFFFAMINWQYSLAQDNDSSQNILNDSSTALAFGNSGALAQNYTDDSNVVLRSYVNSSIGTGGDNLLVEATPGITQTVFKMPKTIFNLITEYVGTNLLSTGQMVVMTLIGGTFMILFILYSIKLVRQGVPD